MHSHTSQAAGVDVSAELVKFHATYYSANIMKLSIIGKGHSLFKLLLLLFCFPFIVCMRLVVINYRALGCSGEMGR